MTACVTALKEGQFEDAAKLLSVDGAEDALVYSVIRYRLEFWECLKCGDQRALFGVEEKLGSDWVHPEQYQESYRYADGHVIDHLKT
ncbi:MAG: hypothetical protein WB714_14080 [Candidatus Sulfotelmatobacter sp.]